MSQRVRPSETCTCNCFADADSGHLPSCPVVWVAVYPDTALLDWAQDNHAGVWHCKETDRWCSRAGDNFTSMRRALEAACDPTILTADERRRARRR